MKELNKGLNVNLDMPRQVEFNRKKNIYQDNQIKVLNSKVNKLLELNPVGFLPKVYYGITRGAQTFRFTKDDIINIPNIEGFEGDTFELYDIDFKDEHVPAIAILLEEDNIQIEIQGDYKNKTENIKLVNMRTGFSITKDLSSNLSLQDSSYLGEIDAQTNKNKQVTAIYNVATGTYNTVYVSIDINDDGIFSWNNIVSFVNGIHGRSVIGVSSSNISSILNTAKVNDILLSGEEFLYSGINFEIGDLKVITKKTPLELTNVGNIRGEQGVQGIQGIAGNDGVDGITPHIQDSYWYIGSTNTGVIAVGEDGTDGQDGVSFKVKSGLYSTIENYGKTGNVGPDNEGLLELPTLPSIDVSGFGFIVFDPLTTPLNPNYDLYWANDMDFDWSVIKNYNGRPGKDGVDGYTPYIQDGKWYINNVNTGVNATGPQGPQGPQGPLPSLISIIDLIYPIGSIYINTVNTNPKILFGGTWAALLSNGTLPLGSLAPVISVEGKERDLSTFDGSQLTFRNENGGTIGISNRDISIGKTRGLQTKTEISGTAESGLSTSNLWTNLSISEKKISGIYIWKRTE